MHKKYNDRNIHKDEIEGENYNMVHKLKTRNLQDTKICTIQNLEEIMKKNLRQGQKNPQVCGAPKCLVLYLTDYC